MGGRVALLLIVFYLYNKSDYDFLNLDLYSLQTKILNMA